VLGLRVDDLSRKFTMVTGLDVNAVAKNHTHEVVRRPTTDDVASQFTSPLCCFEAKHPGSIDPVAFLCRVGGRLL